jgi:hypothetical protein
VIDPLGVKVGIEPRIFFVDKKNSAHLLLPQRTKTKI